MKKAILFILIIILLIPINIYAASDIDYYNVHIKEIKEYNPQFNIDYAKRLIRLNSNLKTADILKKLYSSIDEYSKFYSSDELGVNLFAKEDLVEQSIEYKILDNFGYIIVSSFYNGVYDDFLLALEYMDVNQISNIILDLRDNSGGEITESIEIAKLFVKEGLIAKIDYYSEEFEDVEYCSNLKNINYKLMVLINNKTASAAELLAGAIQDSNSGMLVGQKTYGKSRVQKFIPIMTEDSFIEINKDLIEPTVNLIKASEAGAVWDSLYLSGWAKLTVGKFYTQNGCDIEGIGITPDYILNDKLSCLQVEALLAFF